MLLETDELDINIIARLVAVETLVELLWTDRLGRMENPKRAAQNFRSDVLKLIAPFDESEGEISQVARECVEALERRLDGIVRTKSKRMKKKKQGVNSSVLTYLQLDKGHPKCWYLTTSMCPCPHIKAEG